MAEAQDLKVLLDLEPDELAFLSELPGKLRCHTFSELMNTADRVARSRAGVEAVLQGVHPQIPATDRAYLDRVEFRLRAWWKAIENELQRRCDGEQAGGPQNV